MEEQGRSDLLGVKFRCKLTGQIYEALIINFVSRQVRYKSETGNWCIRAFEDIDILDKFLTI